MSALAQVRGRIDAAARAAGRDPATITLVAVSKVQPLERIEAVLAEGQRVFGENRVQEAAAKWPALRERFPGIELHLIGPLQSNKVRQAVEVFDVIQSVDRPKLARRLAEVMAETGRHLPVFVQVNTGAEPQKAGCLPDETEALVAECRAAGLDVRGLMCIPPVEDAPGPHFERLAALAALCGLPDLSMGMSGDFELAVSQGATHVRVGSALFGERAHA